MDRVEKEHKESKKSLDEKKNHLEALQAENEELKEKAGEALDYK